MPNGLNKCLFEHTLKVNGVQIVKYHHRQQNLVPDMSVPTFTCWVLWNDSYWSFSST